MQFITVLTLGVGESPHCAVILGSEGHPGPALSWQGDLGGLPASPWTCANLGLTGKREPPPAHGMDSRAGEERHLSLYNSPFYRWGSERGSALLQNTQLVNCGGGFESRRARLYSRVLGLSRFTL